jgi:hypothetical protein
MGAPLSTLESFIKPGLSFAGPSCQTHCRAETWPGPADAQAGVESNLECGDLSPLLILHR